MKPPARNPTLARHSVFPTRFHFYEVSYSPADERGLFDEPGRALRKAMCFIACSMLYLLSGVRLQQRLESQTGY